MSPESSANLRPWAALWRTVKTDRWVQLTALAFVVVWLFDLLPALGWSSGQTGTGVALGATALLIFRALAVVALWSDLDRVQVEERNFWNDVCIAFSLWLLVTFLDLLFPDSQRPPTLWWSVEMLCAVSYVALILAAERSPDRTHRWRFTDLERALAWPTATTFTLGLFVYFLVVPGLAAVNGQMPRGLSHPLHLILAVYLTVRFFSLSRVTESPRWRMLYAILALTLAMTAWGHLLRWQMVNGGPSAWEGLVAAAIANAAYLVVALVRARQLPFPEDTGHSHFEERSDFHFNRPSRQTLIHALAFPLLHFVCYRLGFFATAHRSRHETIAIGMLLLLVSIAFIQHRLLERKARELWFDREKVEGSLRSSETDLRLMVERYHADQKVRLSEEKFAKAFQVSPDAMAITTLSDGQLLDVNEKFVQITGYGREEAIGRTTPELNLWVEPEERKEMAQTLAREGGVREMEGRFRTKSGDTIIALFSAEQLIIEGEPYLLSVTHDITERKHTEARLTEQIKLLEETAGLKAPSTS